MAFQPIGSVALAKEQIAVAISHGAFGSHLGIGYQTQSEGPQLLHLRFHKDLKCESISTGLSLCWIMCVVQVPPSASKQLVAIVRSIAATMPVICYGLNILSGHGSFDAMGRYVAPVGSLGLTCSTFVTEIFRAYALPLVDESTWQAADENLAWAERVCTMLQERGADDHHIQAVKSDANGLRMRPEEVSAAADSPFTSRPLDFASAQPLASAVTVRLGDLCPNPNPRTQRGVITNLIDFVFQSRKRSTRT